MILLQFRLNWSNFFSHALYISNNITYENSHFYFHIFFGHMRTIVINIQIYIIYSLYGYSTRMPFVTCSGFETLFYRTLFTTVDEANYENWLLTSKPLILAIWYFLLHLFVCIPQNIMSTKHEQMYPYIEYIIFNYLFSPYYSVASINFNLD